MTRPPRRKQTLHIVIEENEKMAAMKRLLEEKEEAHEREKLAHHATTIRYGGAVEYNARLLEQLRELGVKPVK